MTRLHISGESIAVSNALIERLSTSGPRYTSYPTAPEWSAEVDIAAYRDALGEERIRTADTSVYVHLPFCERACYFCGCHTVITQKRELADVYLDYLEKEIAETARALGGRSRVVQMQWGGGTPTYLGVDQLRRLHGALTRHFDLAADGEVSLEIHPNVTTDEQLDALRDLGFNRISMGVQDFDPKVQQAVNRIEKRERVKAIVAGSRRLGFESVNVDLIYGLPHQTVERFEQTIDAIVDISPDRIALFNYAHVPWMKPYQKYISERDLPTGAVKFEIFRMSIGKLTDAGYVFVGLDHFAKPTDELVAAQKDRTLKRNFMGYTTHAHTHMLGFGESAIGMMDDLYVQNEKKHVRYQAMIAECGLATRRGMRLTKEDRLRREIIMNILCHMALDYDSIEAKFDITFGEHFRREQEELRSFEADGLIRTTARGFSVTPLGRIFVRNIAMVFDAYLKTPSGGKRLFSKTV